MNMTDIVERIKSRINDAPLTAEYLLDDALAEIERLRAALQPFSEIGARLSAVNSKSDQSVLIGASAVRLNLHPLTGQSFVDAFNAYQQSPNEVPEKSCQCGITSEGRCPVCMGRAR